MSVNKVILVGNLGKDPEMRFTVPAARSASSRSPPARAGTTRTDSARSAPSGTTSSCGASRRRSAAKYLSKGRQVFVEGRIRPRQYDDKDGNKRYITEIIAQRRPFLGGQGGGRGAGASGDPGFPAEEPAMGMGGGGAPATDDEDIPF